MSQKTKTIMKPARPVFQFKKRTGIFGHLLDSITITSGFTTSTTSSLNC